jgi:hypothetical protein
VGESLSITQRQKSKVLNMFLKIVVAVLLTVSAEIVHAQIVTIKGRVVSDNNEGLPGTSIRSKRNYNIGINADENGNFELSVDKADTLIILYLGFEEKQIPAANLGQRQTIVLKSATQAIDEIEISAEQIIAEEFTVKKIRKLEIYTNPGAKADPILAVNSMPSATTLDESANISLRGGSPAETGIFLNNVPINDAVRFSQLNGIGTFSIFNTAIVNSVQVYPGNPPLEFGNSTSGLIAIQTDENIPAKPTNTVSVTLASLGFFSSRKLSERSSLTIFSNYQPSLFLTELNQKSLSNLKKFSSADIGIHFYHQFKKRAVIKIFNYTLSESYKFRYEHPSYDGIFHQRKQRNFTVVNFRKYFGKIELSFNQGLSVSNANYTYGTTDINLTLQDLYSSLHLYHSGEKSEWKTGISFDHKQSRFDGRFPTFDFAAAEHHPTSSAKANDHVSVPEWYGYYKLFLGPRWIAGVGARKNIAMEKLKNYTSFQGNIHFTGSDAFHLNLSAGKYFKYFLQQGNGDPVLTACHQYSLDLNYKVTKFESSLSIFYRDGHASAETSKIKGLEAFTRIRMSRNLQSQLSFTTLNADRMNGNISQPSPYNINYFVRGSLEYKVQGTWTITSIFLVRQGSYYQPVSATLYQDDLQAYEPIYSNDVERLPQYQTFDLSVSKIFPFSQQSTAVVFLSSGNIFNFKNVRTYTYNHNYTTRKEYLFSQRTVYFGIVINF